MNKKIDDGGSAFPEVASCISYDDGYEKDFTETYSKGGMSLRDYAAIHAPEINPASITSRYGEDKTRLEIEWDIRYEWADAMIARKQKDEQA